MKGNFVSSLRKENKSEIEEEVLTSSRRRCAMCFGLKRDHIIKRGQIAHLDGDHSNNDPDNLAFLCLNVPELANKNSRVTKTQESSLRSSAWVENELYRFYHEKGVQSISITHKLRIHHA
jgi:hypothetical protein